MIFPGVSIIMILCFLLKGIDTFSASIPADPDTASINLKTRDAFSLSRRKPDIAIALARQALAESNKISYKKGTADASLALGFAWFARYNRGDSALFYNLKAYDLYRELEDNNGKARSCYGLSYVYSLTGDLAASERYAALCLNFFELDGDKRGIINAYSVLSYLAKQQKDFNKARGLINQAIEVARSTNDTITLADALNSLANIYREMALFSQAVDTYFEALRLWELRKDSNGLAIAYGSIGLMYYYQKEWNKALEYSYKKIPLSLAAGDLWEVSKTYNTVAQIFNAKMKYDSALVYLHKSLILNKEMNYPPGTAAAYHNLASTFLLMEHIDSAYYYINKAISLARNINDPELVKYNITLGNVNKTRGNYSDALKNVLKSYHYAKEHNLPLVVHESSALLSEIYSLINRKDLAYIYLKEYQQLSDSISNDEFYKQLTRLEIGYDYDKREKEAEHRRINEKILADNRIRQQKMFLRGLAVIIFLGALITALYIRHNRLRARYARIALEQKLLRAQMNPHFIFNSLCAIQDLILAGKLQNATTYLTKISRLMRSILENSREEFIPVAKEAETVKLYLDLQQLRFESGFNYEIKIDTSIDPENIAIPPMFAQPCVENSVEHALIPLKTRGNLFVSYTMCDGLIKLEVIDNGIGRAVASSRNAGSNVKSSVSGKLTAERLQNFRKTLRNRAISCVITDLKENGMPAGTKVVMMLPYKKIYE
ncbi:MAG: tetratricopeptide repeat protein [Bacteroidales bacterium]|jgi:tetratricopeptide (TPR) repeat protein|nr:tetratricopeptide repeat protein [Bacteroidales bacterium]